MTIQNPFKQIFSHYSPSLSDAPGAARLARLARTANLIEVGYCDARFADATAFASALANCLQRYIDKLLAADSAREVFRERTAWWGMVVARASELRKWPAIVLTEVSSRA